MSGCLDGQVALVSGGARGIGAAIVRRFCEEGAAVLIADRLDELGHAHAQALSGDGHRVAYTHLDVTDEVGWSRAVSECEGLFGPLTTIVNNAGTTRMQPLHEETLDGWHHVLEVNLTGVFLGTRAALARMLAHGRGVVVNISSIWGDVATEGSAAYHASKGGVTVLTRNAAATYARHGIRVNAVLPGQTRTPMTEATGTAELVIPRTPMGRDAAPEEIADAVVFLASPRAAFVTGVTLAVDGGYTAI